jgi:hypothetical protein
MTRKPASCPANPAPGPPDTGRPRAEAPDEHTSKARQETTVHPIIRRCEFAPNWRICARITLKVLDWRETNIRRFARSRAKNRVTLGN